MGKYKGRVGAIAASMLLALGAAMVGATPASAATLNQQWIVQPSTLPGSAPDSVLFANGSTLDAGVENVQVLSTYAGADVERFRLLGTATLADVEQQLALATSGDPAKAGPAMSWFDRSTVWHSGGSAMEHIRFTVVDGGGTYYAAQITPGRVAATAKQFVVRGSTTATLPSSSQVLRMEANDTFTLNIGGTVPRISRTTLTVKNVSSELHFARFLRVPSTTTVQQATSWCNGSNPGLTPGAPKLGVGTMSGGVTVNVDLSTTAAGRFIVIDGLPDATTGLSHVSTMCKVVDLV